MIIVCLFKSGEWEFCAFQCISFVKSLIFRTEFKQILNESDLILHKMTLGLNYLKPKRNSSNMFKYFQIYYFKTI